MHGGNRDAQINKRKRSWKLKIVLWLGERVSAEGLQGIRREDLTAIDQVRKNPLYGGDLCPTRSSGPRIAEYRLPAAPHFGHREAKHLYGEHFELHRCADRRVTCAPDGVCEQERATECQGLIDGLAELYHTYKEADAEPLTAVRVMGMVPGRYFIAVAVALSR